MGVEQIHSLEQDNKSFRMMVVKFSGMMLLVLLATNAVEGQLPIGGSVVENSREEPLGGFRNLRFGGNSQYGDFDLRGAGFGDGFGRENSQLFAHNSGGYRSLDAQNRDEATSNTDPEVEADVDVPLLDAPNGDEGPMDTENGGEAPKNNAEGEEQAERKIVGWAYGRVLS